MKYILSIAGIAALVFLIWKFKPFHKKAEEKPNEPEDDVKDLNSKTEVGGTTHNKDDSVLASDVSAAMKDKKINNGRFKIINKKSKAMKKEKKNTILFKVGDKVYTTEDANTYKAPDPKKKSNLFKFFRKNQYIGTYLGNEKDFAKVIYEDTASIKGIKLQFGKNKISDFKTIYIPLKYIVTK